MDRRVAVLFIMGSISTVATIIVFTALTATNSSDRLLARAEIAKNSTITSAGNTTNATSSSQSNASTAAGSSHMYRGGGGAGVGGE
jgi:hypothetical protein